MKIQIEVFSAPGCSKCAQAQLALKAVTEELGEKHFIWRDVNVLADIDRAVELGVMAPPSLAIDGELVFAALPSPERLRQELAQRLARTASPFPSSS